MSTPAAALATRLLARMDVKPVAALSSAALAIGGLIVLAFFVRIRFMPDADLASTTAILLAVALVGLASMMTYLFVALLPGILTAMVVRGRGLPADRWIDWLLPGAGLVVTVAVLAIASTRWPGLMRHIVPILLGAAAAVGLLATVRAAQLRARASSDASPEWLGTAVDFCALSLTSGLWFVGLFSALQLALSLGGQSELAPWFSVMCALAWTAYIAGINIAASHLPVRVAVVFAALCLVPAGFVLILISGGPGPLASYVLRQLGMGELDRVELVVEPAVCRSLALASPAEFRCEATNPEGTGVLRGLKVRSRIGTQVVVEPQRPTETPFKGQHRAQLILRKSDIVLWLRH